MTSSNGIFQKNISGVIFLDRTLNLKDEPCQHYQTRFEAQQDVLSYITVQYNNFRLHSSLGYKNPNQFELAFKTRGLK